MDVFRILKEDISALSLPELHDDVSEDTLTHLDTLAKQADATELALSYMMTRSFSIQKLYEKLLKNTELSYPMTLTTVLLSGKPSAARKRLRR